MSRYLPVAPGTCRMPPTADDRTAFHIRRSFDEALERMVLPQDAEDDDSVVSRLARARFTAAPNRGQAVGRRSPQGRGLAACLMKSAVGLRRRKLEFRVRMRQCRTGDVEAAALSISRRISQRRARR